MRWFAGHHICTMMRHTLTHEHLHVYMHTDRASSRSENPSPHPRFCQRLPENQRSPTHTISSSRLQCVYWRHLVFFTELKLLCNFNAGVGGAHLQTAPTPPGEARPAQLSLRARSQSLGSSIHSTNPAPLPSLPCSRTLQDETGAEGEETFAYKGEKALHSWGGATVGMGASQAGSPRVK